ncbi:glyoxalase [Floricoccus penangensis]|uniref:glyoxalase n=1 Tax=Floricoccus penangensis TaxID=1859475 RepID=UPI002041A629|nr:glyoxalase [Floricoccus penangensis]URZ87576.1 glyoxalase [Floricoccus penangensis]
MSIIFVSVPVADVALSTTFYERLGFVKNDDFSNETVSSMVWDENLTVMVQSHDHLKNFIGAKTIVDPKTSVTNVIAVGLDSKDEVIEVGRRALENGGNSFRTDENMPVEFMYSVIIEDIDGNPLKLVWMAV